MSGDNVLSGGTRALPGRSAQEEREASSLPGSHWKPRLAAADRRKLGSHHTCLGTALLPLTGAGHYKRLDDTVVPDRVCGWSGREVQTMAE